MANLAQLKAGGLVLDPYCGGGSLLLAAAHIGAVVVGADIALPDVSPSLLSSSSSSSSSSHARCEDDGKNVRDKAEDTGKVRSQQEGTGGARQNFEFFGARVCFVWLDIRCAVEEY